MRCGQDRRETGQERKEGQASLSDSFTDYLSLDALNRCCVLCRQRVQGLWVAASGLLLVMQDLGEERDSYCAYDTLTPVERADAELYCTVQYSYPKHSRVQRNMVKCGSRVKYSTAGSGAVGSSPAFLSSALRLLVVVVKHIFIAVLLTHQVKDTRTLLCY